MVHIILAVAVLLMPRTVQSFNTGGAIVRCVAIYHTRAFLCADKRVLEASWPDTPSSAPARPFAPAVGGQGDPCAVPVAPLAADVETSRARLWLLDGGDERCPPQVFVYDLRGNKEIWRCPLDAVPVGAARVIAVDAEAVTMGDLSGGGGVRAYVGDSGRGGLVVLALRERRYWFLDVDAKHCGVGSVRAHALAIARRPAAPALRIGASQPALYLLDPSGDQLLSVELVTERARPAPPVYDRRPEVVTVRATCVGRLLGASSGLAFDFRLGLHYFLRRDAAAVCWDTRHALNAEAHKVLLQEAMEESPEINSCSSSSNETSSFHSDLQNPAGDRSPNKDFMGQDEVSSQTLSEFVTSVPPGKINADESQLLEVPHAHEPPTTPHQPRDQSEASPHQQILSLKEQEIPIYELSQSTDRISSSSENPPITSNPPIRDLSLEISTESSYSTHALYKEEVISEELNQIESKIEDVCPVQDLLNSRQNQPHTVHSVAASFEDEDLSVYVPESQKKELKNDKISLSTETNEINNMKEKYFNEFVASLLSTGMEKEEIHDSICLERDEEKIRGEGTEMDDTVSYTLDDSLLNEFQDQTEGFDSTFIKQHSNEDINYDWESEESPIQFASLNEKSEDTIHKVIKRQSESEISSVEESFTETIYEDNLQIHSTEEQKLDSRINSDFSRVIAAEVEDDNDENSPSTYLRAEYQHDGLKEYEKTILPKTKCLSAEASTDYTAEEIVAKNKQEEENCDSSKEHSSVKGLDAMGLKNSQDFTLTVSNQNINELKEYSNDLIEKSSHEKHSSENVLIESLRDKPPEIIEVELNKLHDHNIVKTNDKRDLTQSSTPDNENIVSKSTENVLGGKIFSLEKTSQLEKRSLDKEEEYEVSDIEQETTDSSIAPDDILIKYNHRGFNLKFPPNIESRDREPFVNEDWPVVQKNLRVDNSKEIFLNSDYFSDGIQNENKFPETMEEFGRIADHFEVPSAIAITHDKTKENVNNERDMNIKVKRLSSVPNSTEQLPLLTDNPFEHDAILSQEDTPSVISLDDVSVNDYQIYVPSQSTTESLENQDDEEYQKFQNSGLQNLKEMNSRDNDHTCTAENLEIESSHKDLEASPVSSTPELKKIAELKEETRVLSSDLEWAVTGTIRPDHAVCGALPQYPATQLSHGNLPTSQVLSSIVPNIPPEETDITNHFVQKTNQYKSDVREISGDEKNVKVEEEYKKEKNVLQVHHTNLVGFNYESLPEKKGIIEKVEKSTDSRGLINQPQNPVSKISSNEQVLIEEDNRLLLPPLVPGEELVTEEEEDNGQEDTGQDNANSLKPSKKSQFRSPNISSKVSPIQKENDHREIQRGATEEMRSVSYRVQNANTNADPANGFIKEPQELAIANQSTNITLSHNLEDGVNVPAKNLRKGGNNGLEAISNQLSYPRVKRKGLHDYNPSSPSISREGEESKIERDKDEKLNQETVKETTDENTDLSLKPYQEKADVRSVRKNYNSAKNDITKGKLPPIPGLPYDFDDDETIEGDESELGFGEFQEEPVQINVKIYLLPAINIIQSPSHPETTKHVEVPEYKITDTRKPLVKTSTLDEMRHGTDFIGSHQQTTQTSSDLPIVKSPVPKDNDQITHDGRKIMRLFVPPESTREVIRTRRGLGDSSLKWKLNLPQPQKLQLQFPTTMAMPPLLGFPGHAGKQSDQLSAFNSTWQRHCVLVQKFSYF